MATADVLVITALKEELDALLEVTAGCVEPWRATEGDLPYHLATFDGPRGPIRVAAARTTRMAGVAAAAVAMRLAELLSPGCLAMCGVCAGRPEDTDLGDAVIADRVFQHDHGKLVSDGFQGDQWTHALGDAWLRAAQDMAGPGTGLHGYATPDDDTGRWWLLEQLLAGRDPLRSAALRRYIPDARRPAMLETLWRELGYITRTGKTFALTEAGRDAAHEREVLYGTLVTERPYHVHVGPMASGNYVAANGEIWARLSEHQAMRKTLAVEMEAAAIGQVAHQRSLPFVVVKGVMDHADAHKTDRFKTFAARAAAEVLCAFLRRVVTTTARPATGTAAAAAAQTPHGPVVAPSTDGVGEVTDERLTDELAKVIWEPEPARAIAIAAGFNPGRIPVMKAPQIFWSRIVEDARNGAIRGHVKTVAEAASRVFPENAVFRRYRGG